MVIHTVYLNNAKFPYWHQAQIAHYRPGHEGLQVIKAIFVGKIVHCKVKIGNT